MNKKKMVSASVQLSTNQIERLMDYCTKTNICQLCGDEVNAFAEKVILADVKLWSNTKNNSLHIIVMCKACFQNIKEAIDKRGD